MAITFREQGKKKKYLIWIIGASLAIVLFVVGRGFVSKRKTAILLLPTVSTTEMKKININYQVLKDMNMTEGEREKLKLSPSLKIPPQVPTFEDEFKKISAEKLGKKIISTPGRENPFMPY